MHARDAIASDSAIKIGVLRIPSTKHWRTKEGYSKNQLPTESPASLVPCATPGAAEGAVVEALRGGAQGQAAVQPATRGRWRWLPVR